MKVIIILSVPVWPRGRGLRRLGREAETLEDLAERPRPEKNWLRGRDLRRLGREAEGPRP